MNKLKGSKLPKEVEKDEFDGLTDEEAKKLADALPSSTSKDYGKPFADIFKAYEYDFFKIDAMLFSPASVIVTAVESGNTFRAGHIDNALLDQSFGL